MSDRYRFVFIHVPKCAGTSVRAAVLPFHDADSRFLKEVERHPDFGDIDFRHLPLALLREIDPDAFEKLKTYDSFALLRDPFQRFRSALAQRAKMYLGKEFAQLDQSDIRAEIGRVFDYLQAEPRVIKPEFIHFSRQSDFVAIDGTQLVRHLYPIERLDLLGAALGRLIGTDDLPIGHANETMVFRHPQLKALLRSSSSAARWLLPGAVHEALRVHTRRKLMKPGGTAPLPMFDDVSVQAFISSYYSADITLYKAASAKATT
ncbi:sulfotransferase family 2 domain-containing protein [Roseovarius arcticus]|uniref:sulfotransferase family 2 domain-containing protein n=1 Tax=Roseovarius arcticus TaxID=2547404 RepID=UPI0014866723|nr:sulfotransferase family 2 domain-containing protein [Roseovarius arcticus]